MIEVKEDSLKIGCIQVEVARSVLSNHYYCEIKSKNMYDSVSIGDTKDQAINTLSAIGNFFLNAAEEIYYESL